jgi:hypothetical protein
LKLKFVALETELGIIQGVKISGPFPNSGGIGCQAVVINPAVFIIRS